MKIYVKKLRPILNWSSNEYLLVANDAEKRPHGAIGTAVRALEYPRVSPTRIQCACATFSHMEEGIDSVFFATHLMKNKEETTNMHYNLYANHPQALKLAMIVGDTFELGGVGGVHPRIKL